MSRSLIHQRIQDLNALRDEAALNETAFREQGPEVLVEIVRQLVMMMRRNVRTDWIVREDVRSKLRSAVRRFPVLNRYPPDNQSADIKLVIEQMESPAQRHIA